MSWLALFDPEGADRWVDPKVRQRLQDDPDARLGRGSIMLEARISADARPQMLIDFQRAQSGSVGLSVQSLPRGGLVLVLSQGGDILHEVLRPKAESRTETLRVTLSWDMERGMGRLSAAPPESDLVDTVSFRPEFAFGFADLLAMVTAAGASADGDTLRYLAISDRAEPVGPLPTLAPSVPVETALGRRPVGGLRRGDLVRNASGELEPVLHVVRHRVPALGAFRPVRIRAPYFGLMQDIVVAPNQRLLVGGPEVEYIFGREGVLIPASTLLSGFAAGVEPAPRFVDYVQLVLPRHDAVHIPEAALETLYLGRLRRRPEALQRSALAGIDRSLLPEHHRASYQVLRPFEAITLAEARAA